MKIGVPKETAPNERRVALVPDTVAKLCKAGHEIVVEHGAGDAASIFGRRLSGRGRHARRRAGCGGGGHRRPRAAPERGRGGAPARRRDSRVLPPASPQPRPVRRFRAPPRHRVRHGARPAHHPGAIDGRAVVAEHGRGLQGGAARRRRSSAACSRCSRRPPAPSRRPRSSFSAPGVAGLQAIATARRLGAVVSAFDVRPAVKEQVESLGARFVAAEAVSASGRGRRRLCHRARRGTAPPRARAHRGASPGDRPRRHDGADPEPTARPGSSRPRWSSA